MKIKLFIPLLFFLSFVFISDTHSQSKISDFNNLIGSWLRPDGGYVLVINTVDDQGQKSLL